MVDTITGKSFVFDIADNWGGSTLGVRSIDFYDENDALIVATFTAYHTSAISSSYWSSRAFDTTKSKIGSWSYNAYLSSSITNQRIICTFNDTQTVSRIVVNNSHTTGGQTTTGSKNVKAYVSTDAITSTVYDSSISNSYLIYDGIFNEHDTVNAADDQELVIDFPSLDIVIPSQEIEFAPGHSSSPQISINSQEIEFANSVVGDVFLGVSIPSQEISFNPDFSSGFQISIAPATIEFTQDISATPSLSIPPQDVLFITGLTGDVFIGLSSSPATVTITPSEASMLITRVLKSDPCEISIVPSDSSMLISRKLNSDPADVSIIMSDADMVITRKPAFEAATTVVSWLFDIGENKWSTKSVSYDGAYTAKIIPESFQGVTTRWDITRQGVVAPGETSFDIENVDGVLDPDDLEGEECLIQMVAKEGANLFPTNLNIRKWRFKIKSAAPAYGKIKIICEDILQSYMIGSYPNTPHPRSVWTSASYDPQDGEYDDYRIPVIFGQAYIPLMYIYDSGDKKGYYALGDEDEYDISEVRAPVESNNVVWDAEDYTFNQSLDSGYRLGEFVVAPTGVDGVFSAGTWNSGTKPMVKYNVTDGDTPANPADVISTIFEDFGISSTLIDADAMSYASAQYSAQSLMWNGGFYESKSRDSLLNNILMQCDSSIYVGDKIELRPFASAPVETFDKTKIIKGSFSASRITSSESTKGRVTWPPEGTPQNLSLGLSELTFKVSENPLVDGETLNCRFINNGSIAKNLANIYFKRKLNGQYNISFSVSGPKIESLSTIKPADVIKIFDDVYGGTHNIMITSIAFNYDLTLDITGIRYDNLYEYSSLSSSDISLSEVEATPNLPIWISETDDDSLKQATSKTNNLGNWSSISGTVDAQSSVFHDGKHWYNPQDIESAAAHEPGVSGSWFKLPLADFYDILNPVNDIDPETSETIFSIDCSTGNCFECDFSESGTFEFNNVPPGFYKMTLFISISYPFVVSWPWIGWPSDVSPGPTLGNGVNIIVLYSLNSGSSWVADHPVYIDT